MAFKNSPQELELPGEKLPWFLRWMRCFSCMPQRCPFTASAHLHRSWKMAKWDCWGNLSLKHCYCSWHCHLLLWLCFMMWDLQCLPTEEGKWAFSRNKGRITESILYSRLLWCHAYSVLSRSLRDTDSRLIKALFTDAALLPAHLKGGAFKIQGWPFCCSHWMPSEWRTSSLQRPL